MEIETTQAEGKPGVVILTLNGDLDGSNFQDVIAKAQQVKTDGASHLLIDMAEVPFMGSAGLVALHSIALLMQGEELPDFENGWAVLHNLKADVTKGPQPYVKITNPQPAIQRGLDKTGMSVFFEIYPDRDSALGSF